ncbi:MAG TPA: HAD family hydrolase [Actinomycetota bacterium]|nr:HAD family hydrolase [Actinomycetota bacterium]
MGAGGVRGVFFDRDGTLVDSLGVVVDCYRRAIVEFEGPDRSADQIFASFSIGLARAMLSELIGRPVGDMAVVRYESLLADRCDEIRPYQGIRDAVARLGRSLPFTVFTAADTSAANIILGATGLSPFFASVVGADLVASTQPAPDRLVEAARRLGLDRAEVAYVGDGPSDFATARSLRCAGDRCGLGASARSRERRRSRGRRSRALGHAAPRAGRRFARAVAVR